MQRFGLALAFVLIGSAAHAQSPVFVPDVIPLDGQIRPLTGAWTYPTPPPQQPVVVQQPTQTLPYDEMPIYRKRQFR